mmetsp:Transcript_974/g.1715  ORF Transcript_974/g.1715 Transcript_974/m.1715 type:complete len:361 (-) Transcript_974:312-1394(-)|eukprot:CAMPEP_0198198000 /NCGR_PEP_ID=MMETSP1445-20131203/1533_1 /TAXON_ID=36898 /ORGANISM="Pyramimonas sp., Strain CCMP2087" /LENGTH=360 /DNA_ID=CAMNT_0043867433 /DNA_START=421 /DNA_END=1503 /DNA_ORIENTATION=+
MSGFGSFFSGGESGFPTTATRRPLFSGTDIEAGSGTSLLAEWKSYATTTASKLGDLGEKLQTNSSGVFNAASNTTSGLTGSLSGSFSGLSNLGTASFGNLGNLSATGFSETFRGANTSLTGAFTSVTTGVEGLSTQMATSMKSGANRLTSEMQNAATLATDATQRGMHATSTGIQLAGSATASHVHGVSSAVTSGVKGSVDALQSFSRQRLMYFFILLFMGIFLMLLAFIIGLPVILLAPAKFAFCFTAGSLCNMGAIGALRGPQAQLQQMASWERLPLSASYVCSMLGTLWAAMIYHSYILTVVFSAWQVIALVYYIATHFPMGVTGMRVVAQIIWTALTPFIMIVKQCFTATMRTLIK